MKEIKDYLQEDSLLLVHRLDGKRAAIHTEIEPGKEI